MKLKPKRSLSIHIEDKARTILLKTHEAEATHLKTHNAEATHLKTHNAEVRQYKKPRSRNEAKLLVLKLRLREAEAKAVFLPMLLHTCLIVVHSEPIMY